MSVDFTKVHPEHEAIHDRLLNWARWCRGSRGQNVHPMFRQYRNDYWEPSPAPSCSNVLDAVEVQKIMKDLPERHRIALQWFYVVKCGPRRICMALGESTSGLETLVHNGRAMAKNLIASKEVQASPKATETA